LRRPEGSKELAPEKPVGAVPALSAVLLVGGGEEVSALWTWGAGAAVGLGVGFGSDGVGDVALFVSMGGSKVVECCPTCPPVCAAPFSGYMNPKNRRR